MKYVVFNIELPEEIVKKLYDRRDSLTSKIVRNIKGIIQTGKKMKVYTTFDRDGFYFSFFTGVNYVFPSVLKCLIYGIKIEKNQTPFLAEFCTCYNDLITRADIDLTEQEKKLLLESLKKRFDFSYFIYGEEIILVLNDKFPVFNLPEPSEIEGKKIKDVFPRTANFSPLRDFIITSSRILEEHEVNKIREDLNQPVANFIYLWGNGEYTGAEIEIPEKRIYLMNYGKRKYGEIVKILGGSEIEKIDNLEDDCIYWITFSFNEESSYFLFKSLENFDKNIVDKVMKIKQNIRILFLFEGKEKVRYWINCLFYAGEEKKFKHLRRIKDVKILHSLMFK